MRGSRAQNGWNTQSLAFANRLICDARENADVYRKMATQAQKVNTRLSLVVKVSAALCGVIGAVGAAVSQTDTSEGQEAVLGITIATAILAAMGTLAANLSDTWHTTETQSQTLTAAVQYSEIAQSTTLHLTLPARRRQRATAYLSQMQTKMHRIEQSSPLIDERFRPRRGSPEPALPASSSDSGGSGGSGGDGGSGGGGGGGSGGDETPLGSEDGAAYYDETVYTDGSAETPRGAVRQNACLLGGPPVAPRRSQTAAPAPARTPVRVHRAAASAPSSLAPPPPLEPIGGGSEEGPALPPAGSSEPALPPRRAAPPVGSSEPALPPPAGSSEPAPPRDPSSKSYSGSPGSLARSRSRRRRRRFADAPRSGSRNLLMLQDLDRAFTGAGGGAESPA